MSTLPRARPVTDLPIEAMAEDAEDLARRWAIALVLSRPLDGLGGIPLEELAREAPALCAQLLAALESEAALELLTVDAPRSGREEAAPARRLRAICGADEPASLVQAVEALRGVVWEALLERLGSQGLHAAPTRLVADAGDRLAYACARVLAASVGEDRGEGERARRPADATVAVSAPAAVQSPLRPGTEALARAPEPDTGVRERAEGFRSRLAIIDEAVPAHERRSGPGEPAAHTREIEIRDARGEGERMAWLAAISREVERFKRDGRPFAVLLVQLRGVDALAAGGSPERAARLAQDAERMLAAEVRQAARSHPAPADARGTARLGSLTRESVGRLWLIAPDTSRAEASELAWRLERAVGRPANHGGGMLEASIGAAVCPDDGTETGTLAAHADMELYASRKGEAVSGSGGATPPRATS